MVMELDCVLLKRLSRILDYYVGQLGTPFSEKRDAQQVLNLVLTQKVDQDVGMDLVKPVTALEVKQAM